MKTNEGYYPPGSDLSYSKISHEEERQLFVAARAGDESAKELIIKNHLLFATTQGRRFSHGNLPEDEVVSAANYGLILAFERFDHTRNNRFASYAQPFIRAEIAKLWRSRNTMGEHRPKFEERTLDNPEPLREGLEFVPPEFEDHPTEAEDHRQFLVSLVKECAEGLTELEAEIIRRHYGEESECLSKIGDEKKLCRERIRQLKDSALKKLRRWVERKLREKGVQR